MNDNDIIKALKCCSLRNKCYHCPMMGKKDCMTKLYGLALELINQQGETVERLRKSLNLTQREQYTNGRNDGIREFAERIELKLANNTDISAVGYQSVIADIRNVVKEMTEEQK